MAKNRNKKKSASVQKKAGPVSSVPKFEIGVKGDEFDLKYTRAAAAKTSDADSLLRGLSKETRVAGCNLINVAVLTLTVLILALSFAFLSRSGSAPKLTIASILRGGGTAELSEYYKDTLPFGRALRTLGAHLGFCDMPEPEREPPEPDDSETPLPAVTTSVTTEPPVTTTLPPTTAAPATEPPVTLTVFEEPPETHTMYAAETVNIRLMPDDSSMIMGYFSRNEKVEVIEIREDGWASIWYNGFEAYVSADSLSEKRVRSRSTTVLETEPVTTETEPETVLSTVETYTSEEMSSEETSAETSVTTTYYFDYPPQTPPPQTVPTVPQPPVTEPPVTYPPVTDPPATSPPETSPPESSETEPTQSEPSETTPLVTAPPETSPYETEPSAPESGQDTPDVSEP